MLDISELKFDGQGLIPAVVTDFYTKEVLTVAYMNRESLEISIKEGRTCFWSRSRQELWRKGETSGNVQHIVYIKADCDRDALTVEVVKDGPACHLGTESCFNDYVYSSDTLPEYTLDGLYNLLEGRKEHPTEGSYTSYLFNEGNDKILKKVGEESTEVIVAGKGGDKAEVIFEVSDLVYHVMVLLVNMGISLNDIRDELKKRHIVDKKVKQKHMQ
ncbi:MAG: bifunctional phosphoribosyl-AMP cyclohydrolase/phosphoribosyl-ATP diphosphatase HisIE [Clostridia bacterium]|nr:bifunctional phosphoribosyl-AMP cyclohydrolase/phosphoribosyl-ATP diphosphatase HisIE [Clostridia bacterium]